MEEESKLPELSLDFVSEMVGRPAASFKIRTATMPGENYMSVLYCLDIQLVPEDKNQGPEDLHVICKCYPLNPIRQSFLNKANTFWNELQIYRTWIPSLQKFADNNAAKGKGKEEIRLSFAPLVNGTATDFGTGNVNEERLAALGPDHAFGSFDQYIAMVDMKRTHGFRLANRFTGIGLDEVRLVMNEHAKLHASAWAYKSANGLEKIADRFPFLTFEFREEDMAMWVGMMGANCNSAGGVLEKAVDKGADPALAEGTKAFGEKIAAISRAMFGDDELALRKLLRVPLEACSATDGANYQPWRTVVHGDCWVNNLLFKYDEDGKATDVVLIDLQIMREACPTIDLAYLLYTSTTQQFRADHLDSMLRLYHDKFVHYCGLYGVAPYPGFSLAELRRRFHASKLIGYMMALMALPIMLKSAEEAPDMEKLTLKEGADPMEMFEEMIKMGESGDNRLFHERLRGVAEDLYTDGVI